MASRVTIPAGLTTNQQRITTPDLLTGPGGGALGPRDDPYNSIEAVNGVSRWQDEIFLFNPVYLISALQSHYLLVLGSLQGRTVLRWFEGMEAKYSLFIRKIDFTEGCSFSFCHRKDAVS